MTKSGLAILLTGLFACAGLNHGHAQDVPRNSVIELLLTTAPGAPTPRQVVDYYANPEGPPPLRALSAVPPQSVQYFLPERAEGDYLDWLERNPHSTSAQLERYLLLVYGERLAISI